MSDEKTGKILIVDDDKSPLFILIDILQNDYQLLIAKTGEEAVKIAEKNIPDLILLDIILPDINGYQVVEKLQNINETKNIPVIFSSGLDEDSSEDKKQFSSVVDFITKPFNFEEVKRKVDRQFGK